MVSLKPKRPIFSSGPGPKYNFTYILALYGICSAFQWWRMLKSPIDGMNNPMMERTLLKVANVPHAKINIFDETGQKPFSAAMLLVWALVKLKRLQAIDKLKNVVGCKLSDSSLKIVSRPPVVAVWVEDSKRIKACKIIWTKVSVPKITSPKCIYLTEPKVRVRFQDK